MSGLRERARALEDLRRAAARASSVRPRVVTVLGPAGSGRSALLDEAGDQLATTWDLRSIAPPRVVGSVPRRAGQRAVAVVLDDAEDQSEATLEDLADQLDAGGVGLAVLALRSRVPADGSALARVVRRPGTVEVALGALSIDAVRDMVAACSGTDDAPDASEIHRRSGGLPGFVTALMHGTGDPLPTAMCHQVRRALDALPDAQRELIELLAVAKGPVPADVLEAGTPRPEILAVHDAGLAVVTPDGLAVHPPVIAEVLLAELPVRRRTEHQRQLARCWMVAPEPCPSTIATLLDEAGDRQGARGFFVKAAADAVRRGDPSAATVHFLAAQRAGAELDPGTLERAACAAASASRPALAERWGREADGAHRALGDTDAAARVWQHPELAYVRRRVVGCTELRDGSPARLAADAEAAARRRDPDAASIARRACEAARDAHDPEARNVAARALLLAGCPEDSRAEHEALRREAVDRGDAVDEGVQLRALARVALACGDPLGAVLHARAAVAATEGGPGSVPAAFQQIHLATLLTLTGDLDEADALVAPLVHHDDPTVVAVAAIPLAGLDLARGAPARALNRLAPLLPHRDAAGPDAFSGVLLQVMQAHAQLGDHDRALAAFDELDRWAGGRLEPTRPDALVIAARLAAEAGDAAVLDELLAEADAMLDEPGPGVVAVVETIRGLQRRVTGAMSAAAVHARAAAVAAVRAPRPRFAVAAWLDAAETAAAACDPAGARACAAEARALVTSRGLEGDAARLAAVEALVEGAGAAPVDVPPLTPRERSLLGLLTEGCTNRQMADRLHLSEKTVRNQLTTLFAKLGVERRAQAAVLAVQLGIAPPT